MSSTALKMLALALMTIDHIGQFLPNTPLFFHWLGRLSAPLFFYCTAQGFSHTHNKKEYILRLYTASIVMGLVNRLLGQIGYELPGFSAQSVHNNIFRTLFCACVLFFLLDLYRNNDKRFKKYFTFYLIWQIGVWAICRIFSQFFPISTLFTIISESLPTLLGSVSFLEGGWVFLSLGVLFYCVGENKKKLAWGYLCFCLVYFLLTATQFIPRVFLKLQGWIYDIEEYGFGAFSTLLMNAESFLETLFESDIGINVRYSAEMSLLFTDYQWMMIGALPLLLVYNGEKGSGHKWFFYFYYPIHIIVLFFIGGYMSAA